MPERNSDFAHQIQRIWPGLSSQLAKKIGPIKDDLFLEMQNIDLVPKTDQSSNPLDYWGQGYVPSDLRIVDFLMDVGVRRAKLNSEWLTKFLRAAGYREAMIAERVRSYWPAIEMPQIPLRVFTLEERGERFLGRQPDLEAVLEALRSSWPVILIEGLPGAGKTTLAREVAYACAGQPRVETRNLVWPHFAYIVWTTAVGRRLTLNELLDEIAHRLGYAGISQKPLDHKRLAIIDLLAYLVDQQQPVLLVVDNFEDIRDSALADFVTRVPAGVKVVLTSREDARQLHPIFHRFPPALIPLGGLPDEDALTFVRFEAERRAELLPQPKEIEKRGRLATVVTAERETLLPLIKATEGNPKAIELALGYIADNAMPLPTLVRNLYAATDSVEGLFNYFFRQAWERCDEDARALWQVLPFFATAARGEALAAAAGLRGRAFQEALSELQGRSLLDIEEGSEGEARYRAHPLVRGFASIKLRDAAEFEMAARQRWIRYFLEYSKCLTIRDEPQQRYWNTLVRREMALIDLEWPNLRNVLAWVDDHVEEKVLIEFMMLLVHYMDRRVLIADRIRYATKAAEAATKLGQLADAGWLFTDALGWSLTEEGSFEEAQAAIEKGLNISRELKSNDQDAKNIQALSFAWLARVHLHQGDLEKASTFLQDAMRIPCDSVIKTRVYQTAGELAQQSQDYFAAIEFYKQAIAIIRQYRLDEMEHSECRYRLGFAYQEAGQLDLADEQFDQVLSAEWRILTIEAIHARYGKACNALARGNVNEARRFATEAWDALTQLPTRNRLRRKLQDFLLCLSAI